MQLKFSSFWKIHYTFNIKRVESPTAQNWNSSSAKAVFDLKIPSLGIQAKQQKRGKFPESQSDIIQSEIPTNGPLVAFEQNPGPKIPKPSECLTTKSCAGGKSLFPNLCLIGYS